jgi:hypothetical protein
VELTRRWTCDRCFEPIERVEEGWVEWLEIGNGQNYRAEKLHLVHANYVSPLKESDWGCQYDQRAVFAATGHTVANLTLDYFVGADGLMQLLRFLEEGRLPQTEVLEMIKRLHIPGYERARHYFKEAIAAGAFEPNTQLGYHYQYQIEETLRYVEERDKR